MTRVRLASVVFLVAVLLWGRPSLAQSHATGRSFASSWSDVPVPGGTAALAAMAGLDSDGVRARLLLDVVRLIYDLRQRENNSERRRGPLRDYVLGMQNMPAAGADDAVPIPLSAEVWSSAVFLKPVPPHALAGAILSDRAASLLYYGLFAAEDGFLEFLGTHRSLLTFLYREHAADFSTLGRSVVVRGGRVDTPGGLEAAALWEGLIGEPVTSPERFIRQLFTRHGGRLAYFLDTLSHLDNAHQQYALGASTANARLRLERFKALFEAFSSADPLWSPQITPFGRMAYDAAHVLNMVALNDEGRLVGPPWLGFWTAAFRDDARLADSAREGTLTTPEGVDAASLVNLIGQPDSLVRKSRLDAVLFAQRVFPSASAAQAPDVFVAVRGVLRAPALIFALERLGVREPEVFAGAARHAQRLLGSGDPKRAATALAQFQGALAIIDRARFNRWIDASAAERLVQSEIAVTLSDENEYAGQIAQWIVRELLPALGRATGIPVDPRGREQLVLRVLAGPATASGGRAAKREGVVRWEDLDYTVDLGASSLARLTKTREKQGSYVLDTALDFSALSAALAAGVASASALQERVGALAALLPMIPPPDTSSDEAAVVVDVRAATEKILDDLRTLRTGISLDRVARIARPLLRISDHLLAETLTSLAYAPYLGDPDGAALLAGDVAARHEFGLAVTTRSRAWTPWSLPQERVGAGVVWHVQGSLLGLDATLASLSLRRIGTDHAPQAPAIHDNDRAVFAQAVALTNPYDLTDASRDRLADAQRQGRARLKSLLATASGLDDLRRVVPFDEWRLRVIAWTATRQPARAMDLFTLADLVWLAPNDIRTLPDLHEWGSSGLPSTGCLCTRFPDPGGWDEVVGRHSTGLLATRLVDLKLRIADLLAELKLPAGLARDVAAAAMQDMLGEARPVHFDDWLSIAHYVRDMTRARLEDFVASLTATGPLVPLTATEP